MDKRLIILAMAAGILLAGACAKTGTAAFRGSYSFVSSGEVVVTIRDTVKKTIKDEITGTVRDTSWIDTMRFAHHLEDERGQMTIVDHNNGKMTILRKTRAGQVLEIPAVLSADSLVMDSYYKRMSIFVNDSVNATINVLIEGCGRMVGKDAVSFRERLGGETPTDIYYESYNPDSDYDINVSDDDIDIKRDSTNKKTNKRVPMTVSGKGILTVAERN